MKNKILTVISTIMLFVPWTNLPLPGLSSGHWNRLSLKL